MSETGPGSGIKGVPLPTDPQNTPQTHSDCSSSAILRRRWKSKGLRSSVTDDDLCNSTARDQNTPTFAVDSHSPVSPRSYQDRYAPDPLQLKKETAFSRWSQLRVICCGERACIFFCSWLESLQVVNPCMRSSWSSETPNNPMIECLIMGEVLKEDRQNLWLSRTINDQLIDSAMAWVIHFMFVLDFGERRNREVTLENEKGKSQLLLRSGTFFFIQLECLKLLLV
ncbi:unnamed protein product [Lactuca saligna]|uniref:Uncharacterized protein n=1 Tax=Lactuca saligna TaxID=75948 RepID=A0AA35YTQ1_LACSI|nr:unnamed protein product [Lactuca saligna]